MNILLTILLISVIVFIFGALILGIPSGTTAIAGSMVGISALIIVLVGGYYIYSTMNKKHGGYDGYSDSSD